MKDNIRRTLYSVCPANMLRRAWKNFPRQQFLDYLEIGKFKHPEIPKFSFTFDIPRFDLPNVKWPKFPAFALPTLKAPELHFPQVSLPSFKIPHIRVPEWKCPHINWPSLAIPKISWPSLPKIHIHIPRLPSPSLPKIHLPTVRFPAFPAFKAPKISLERIQHWAGEFAQFSLASVLAFLVFAALVTAKDYFMTSSAQAYMPSSPNDLGRLEPASGAPETKTGREQSPTTPAERFPIEESSIDVQAVLVPNASTVISSSRDGRIEKINFDNGDTFKKNDILVEYGCEDVKAEIAIAQSEKELTEKKTMAGLKLFKLDIISDYEKLENETKHKQAQARVSLYENKMEECYIRADYDGRVIKRLGNPGEFTRTDRVIMEVASLEFLEAEFLLPSKWLRWVNVGAPIQIKINETDAVYEAAITRLQGEIDPVSQSIQVTAQLSAYKDPLLPGMSGEITLDARSIREAGIKGFLESGPAN